MRKTIRIDGKRHSFDTETARPMGHRTVGEYGDPKGYEETLYRTRNHLFFVYGIGGPESPWPESGDIRPLEDETCWK
jgi:hypothetical protein